MLNISKYHKLIVGCSAIATASVGGFVQSADAAGINNQTVQSIPSTTLIAKGGGGKSGGGGLNGSNHGGLNGSNSGGYSPGKGGFYDSEIPEKSVLPEVYATADKTPVKVTIKASWTGTGGVARSRQLTTIMSRNGIK